MHNRDITKHLFPIAKKQWKIDVLFFKVIKIVKLGGGREILINKLCVRCTNLP